MNDGFVPCSNAMQCSNDFITDTCSWQEVCVILDKPVISGYLNKLDSTCLDECLNSTESRENDDVFQPAKNFSENQNYLITMKFFGVNVCNESNFIC